MAGDEDGGTPVGGTVGGRVAAHIAAAMAATRVKMGPHQAALAQTVLRDFTNHISDELQGVLGPLWREAAERPDTPDHVRPLLTALAEERGQAWALVAGTATGAAMGGGLMNLLSNALNPVIFPIIQSAPHNVLSPDVAAAMDVRGVARGFDPFYDSGANGIDRDRYEALRRMAEAQPTTAETLDLLNRGSIDEATARAVLRRAGHAPDSIDHVLSLRRMQLTPEQLAAMWNRSIVDTDGGAAIASRWGMSKEDFTRLTELGGEPLPPDMLMAAYRRGIINEARLQRGIVQGPTRTEWFDVLRDLQYMPMGTQDALTAWAQGHLTDDELRTITNMNGLMQEHLPALMEASGTAPGIQFMLDALNRGEMSEADVIQGIKESRPKNKYIDLIMRMRHNLIPQETARMLYRKAVITREDCKTILIKHGFSDVDSEALLSAESVERTADTRDLTVAEVVRLYGVRAITRDNAAAWLADLGYETDEADWKLLLADLARTERFTSAVVTRLRTGYVARRLDDGAVIQALDQLRVPPDQRDDYIALWSLERDVTTKGLTVAQITGAVKKLGRDREWAMTQLLGQGYSEEHADIVLGLAGIVA